MQTDFDTVILAFDDDLRALKATVVPTKITSSKASIPRESSPVSPVPQHLAALEDHAGEMASLLESLTSHFDMCVDAVRHTEGGYAAFRHAASNPPPGTEPVSVSGVMSLSSEQGHDLVPISDEERREMMQVLETDAAEVDDVVTEIRHRLSEMDVSHDAILEHLTVGRGQLREIVGAYGLLENVGLRLSRYIMAGSDFQGRWSETKAQIYKQMDELESMRQFYENYHASYDSLILEVERRKQTESKVRSIMMRAMEQINKIAEYDRQQRDEFRVDVGDYLPVDLYTGVNEDMSSGISTWRNLHEGATSAEDLHSIPQLAREVVEGASRRESERQRLARAR